MLQEYGGVGRIFTLLLITGRPDPHGAHRPISSGKMPQETRRFQKKGGEWIDHRNSSLPHISPQLLPPFSPLSPDLSCGPKTRCEEADFKGSFANANSFSFSFPSLPFLPRASLTLAVGVMKEKGGSPRRVEKQKVSDCKSLGKLSGGERKFENEALRY